MSSHRSHLRFRLQIALPEDVGELIRSMAEA